LPPKKTPPEKTPVRQTRTPPDTLNVNLKFAIIASKQSQRTIAVEAGIPETMLSRIVRGRALPTHDEAIALARILHRSVGRLFPKLKDDVKVAS
jgi:transcriptional regulator with XRE-family HTH domain